MRRGPLSCGICFRPLSGNIKVLYITATLFESRAPFPSPFGEYKGVIGSTGGKEMGVKKFPSPFGEYKGVI